MSDSTDPLDGHDNDAQQPPNASQELVAQHIALQNHTVSQVLEIEQLRQDNERLRQEAERQNERHRQETDRLRQDNQRLRQVNASLTQSVPTQSGQDQQIVNLQQQNTILQNQMTAILGGFPPAETNFHDTFGDVSHLGFFGNQQGHGNGGHGGRGGGRGRGGRGGGRRGGRGEQT